MSTALFSGRLNGAVMKATTLASVAAVLAISAGPAHAETQADTIADSASTTSRASAALNPDDMAPEDELTDAFAVMDQYWTNHYTEYFGGSYTSPNLVSNTSVGILGIYDGNVDQVSCGQEILEPNNAFYCGVGDFIAVDHNLLQRQYEIGDSFVWLVAAHEWGHAIQARFPSQLAAQAYELQADCLAGAALAGAEADGILLWEDGDSKELVNGLAAIADETPWTNSEDHGDAIQRASSFGQGYSGGPAAC